MSNLDKYIAQMKKKTEGLDELEKIRIVYLDLGNRFKFNEKFYNGNSEKKTDIYRESAFDESIEQGMYNGIIICKTSSKILEKVLNELGINATSEVANDDPDIKHPHVYNIVCLKDGRKIGLDLQLDLKNIQSHSRTRYFGRDTLDDKEIIQRAEIEKIDRKIGYISDENYYTDDYIEMLRYDSLMFDDFFEKISFVFENLELQTYPQMGYLERSWYHNKIFKQIFSQEEMRRIKQLECYVADKDGNKEYRNYIGIEHGFEPIFYRYNEREFKYDKISPEELVNDEKNGLHIVTSILGLKQINKKYSDTNIDK